MNDCLSIIRPESTCKKLAAIKQLEASDACEAFARQPRLLELLHFLQWQSAQPGGISKFVGSFLATFPDSLGTAAMRRIEKETYTRAERQEVIDSFPSPDFRDGERSAALEDFRREMVGEPGDGVLRKEIIPDPAFVNRQNREYFVEACKGVALGTLASILSKFCRAEHYCLPDVWWFEDLRGTLFEMMDSHAGRERHNIVFTKVAETVFDALDFAWDEKAMVEIIGDSRFGKTEAVKAYCAMYPGRARLVKTPCDNNDRSLLNAVAEALGMEVSLKITMRELLAKVEFCLKHCGLMFVFDESAWLLPTRYGAKTVPMRLNWIRSAILENGCPVALIQTPQFYGPAAHNFQRTTGFNMAQWEGRIMRRAKLPTELPENDLAAIVNHHFPELDQRCANRVIGCALVSESYLFAVLKIAKNARAVARKNGHEKIMAEDLEAGISLAGITIPQAAAIPAAPAPAVKKQPLAAKRGRAVTPAPALEAPQRETQPLTIT